ASSFIQNSRLRRPRGVGKRQHPCESGYSMRIQLIACATSGRGEAVSCFPAASLGGPSGGHPSMKLTAKTTAAAKLPAGKTDHIEFDDDLAGFGLRIRAGGGQVSKSWVAQYRAHGRTRRMKIGAFQKLGAEDARKAARKILAQVEMGGDPQSDRR